MRSPLRTYIYTRVSTQGQKTDAQTHALRTKYPTAQIIKEVASGAKQRPKLEKLLARLTAGDTLVVTALDRLGRKTAEVLHLIEDLMTRGVTLISEREGLSYTTLTGKMILQIMAAVAELERGLIAERTTASLAAAKARGVKLGRPVVIDGAASDQVWGLYKEGKGVRQISHVTGLAKTTIARHLKAPKIPLDAVPAQELEPVGII